MNNNQYVIGGGVPKMKTLTVYGIKNRLLEFSYHSQILTGN